MSIISQGGRKNWKIRSIYLFIYAILISGTITMVYPFMLMLSSSVTSPFDFDDLSLIPKYLTNDDSLMKKYLFAKYGRGNFRDLRVLYHRDKDWTTWSVVREESDFINRNFSQITKRYAADPESCQKLISDWNEFKKNLPPEDIIAFFPGDHDAYREFLKNKYLKLCEKKNPDNFKNLSDKRKTLAALNELNRKWQRAFNNFSEILPLKCFLGEQKWSPPQRSDFADLLDYHRQLYPEKIEIIPTRILWTIYLEQKYISPVKFAKQTGIKINQFSDVKIPEKNDKKLWIIWQEFLKKKYPLRLIDIRRDFSSLWQKKLQDEFKTMSAFNKQTGMNISSFSSLNFPASLPQTPMLRSYWQDFVLTNVPLTDWVLNRPVELYRIFLKNKYHNINKVNKTYATDYEDFSLIPLPHKLVDYVEFVANKSQIRGNYFFHNYAEVIEFMFTKGRAVMVTIVLVAFTIIGALTVNPLAAYALSRGKQSTSAKFLILFLATMAFPAEVAMIPGFLLLRDLGLLNTLAALVLPGLANGYSIFLLKGFFDSVPRELYEAADIDGAGEFTKFWRITFPMSKPILAVIALHAFTLSYGGFMWAFLTCQDPKMWTIMVWLYDFQSRYSNEPGMCMAAFALASLPTLLVFLFCQKIIMRGIVIPTMK